MLCVIIIIIIIITTIIIIIIIIIIISSSSSGSRSAQVRAYDDRAYCRDVGIPHKRACALSSHALTYVALRYDNLQHVTRGHITHAISSGTA